jgi:hypothetical protein
MRYLPRVKGLAVEKQLRVKFAGSPTIQNLAYCWNIHSEEIGHGLQIWREGNNAADVQVMIGPSIKTASDTRGQ